MIFFIKIFLSITVFFVASGCTLFGDREYYRSVLLHYNLTESPITVTFKEGFGNFRFHLAFLNGRERGGGYSMLDSRIEINSPITICWVDGLRPEYLRRRPKCQSSDHKYVINDVKGDLIHKKQLTDETILLVYTGKEWQAYFFNKDLRPSMPEGILEIQSQFGRRTGE